MENIYTVTVGGVQHHYPGGTPYQQIAQEFQPQYPNDILLVERDERLCELGKRLDRDCTLRMITIQDKPGMQTYERSAIFLMLKAFYDVVGRERIERICVEYSLSHALFITTQGAFSLDEKLLENVENRMRELVSRRTPCQRMMQSSCSRSENFMIKLSCSAAGLPQQSTITHWRTSPITSMAIWFQIPAISSAFIWSCFTAALFCGCLIPPTQISWHHFTLLSRCFRLFTTIRSDPRL